MSTTLEQPITPALSSGEPTDFLPGSPGKIEAMSLRESLGQELFHAGDMTHARFGDAVRVAYLETCDDLTDDEDYQPKAVTLCNELIDSYLDRLRSRPTTEVSLEPCVTSRDQTLPGCSGRCEFCYQKPRCKLKKTRLPQWVKSIGHRQAGAILSDPLGFRAMSPAELDAVDLGDDSEPQHAKKKADAGLAVEK